MTESLYYITQFTTETLTISGVLLLLVTSILVTYWLYNRKKFQKLGHQIPASVVKNYLDSIIQNSNALKSSLFRGGGLDAGQGIPSVVPLNGLPIGGVSSAGGEEIMQKNAEIASLHAKLAEKNRIIQDFERKVHELESHRPAPSSGGGEEAALLKAELERMQKKLQETQDRLTSAQEAASKGGGGGGGSPELQKQLDAVTKERDELRDRLKEYEIIEEDLANLKRLQQENEKLKKSLAAAGGGGAAAAPAPAPAAAPEPAAEVAEAAEPAPAAEAPAEEAPAEAVAQAEEAPAEEPAAEPQAEVAANPADQKSAEELLSEFEKMIG